MIYRDFGSPARNQARPSRLNTLRGTNGTDPCFFLFGCTCGDGDRCVGVGKVDGRAEVFGIGGAGIEVSNEN